MKLTTARPDDCERELISRAIKGEGSAFAELFKRHKDHVYALGLRMTGNVADAEDLTQEAFIQVFRKLTTFRNESALSTWIYRIAVNTTLMRLRKKHLFEVSLDQGIGGNETKHECDLSHNDAHLSGTVNRLALIQAISELPPGYRNIFLLHDVEGYGHRELARLLRCTEGNTKSQLHKARLRIRQLLRSSKATGQATVASQATEFSSSRQTVSIGSEVCPEAASKVLPGVRPLSEKQVLAWQVRA